MKNRLHLQSTFFDNSTKEQFKNFAKTKDPFSPKLVLRMKILGVIACSMFRTLFKRMIKCMSWNSAMEGSACSARLLHLARRTQSTYTFLFRRNEFLKGWRCILKIWSLLIWTNLIHVIRILSKQIIQSLILCTQKVWKSK